MYQATQVRFMFLKQAGRKSYELCIYDNIKTSGFDMSLPQ